MKRILAGWMGGVIVLTVATVVVPASARPLASVEEAAQAARVLSVDERGGTVSGEIENTGKRLIRDVRLLVRHAFVWRNEREPGPDSPGRSEYYTFPGEVAPGSRASFSFTLDPPLAVRNDGRFVTSAEVVGYSEVGF